MIAYCYRSGEIGFGRRTPKGALAFMSGPGRHVRRTVEACARHARSGTTLLVPGIPEASTELEAAEALTAFSRFVHRRRPTNAQKGALL